MIGFIVVQSLTDLYGHNKWDDGAGAWGVVRCALGHADHGSTRTLGVPCCWLLVIKGAGPLSFDRALAPRAGSKRRLRAACTSLVQPRCRASSIIQSAGVSSRPDGFSQQASSGAPPRALPRTSPRHVVDRVFSSASPKSCTRTLHHIIWHTIGAHINKLRLWQRLDRFAAGVAGFQTVYFHTQPSHFRSIKQQLAQGLHPHHLDFQARMRDLFEVSAGASCQSAIGRARIQRTPRGRDDCKAKGGTDHANWHREVVQHHKRLRIHRTRRRRERHLCSHFSGRAIWADRVWLTIKKSALKCSKGATDGKWLAI